MIEAIIFDFDGVLVESVNIKTRAFAELFRDKGEDIVRRVVDYHIHNSGVSRFDKFRYIYNNILKSQLSDKIFEDLCRNFSKLVFKEVLNAPYVKGAKEFLDKYSGYYKLFVVTATPQKEIEEILEKKGISSCFKGIFGSPGNKTDIVKSILQNNRLLTDRVVYIGDALSDYEAARQNCLKFIARISDNNDIFVNKAVYQKVEDLLNLKGSLNAV